MSKDKRGLGDVEFAGKIKTQTFKQFQQEQLIKAKVLPASKLARQPREMPSNYGNLKLLPRMSSVIRELQDQHLATS